METPFIFGKIATEKNFTDREKETADLVQNFMSLINTIIISPRRWGKSSLVNKAAKLAMAQDSNLRICHIDLFNVRSEEHFYSLLAQKVIAATPYEDANGKFLARLLRVEQDGRFVLEDEGGSEREYLFKEVQYIL